MAKEFDIYIDENDGMIYRHFPPEHPTCSSVFDPDGVNLEQSETELIEIFGAMKSENERLREALEELIRWCKTYMNYHAKKYTESGLAPPTGLWPAIRAAAATLHADDPTAPELPPQESVGSKPPIGGR